MIMIECPNCGARSAQEFRYGGEYNPRPKAPSDTSDQEWTDYVFMRDNRMGIQKEWWYHRSGCGCWFLAERHTKSNHVNRTFFWRENDQSAP